MPVAGQGGEPMADEHDQRPTPDPTVLTTEQLERAVGGLRRAHESLKELLTASVESQGLICDEKFISVNKQFGLVERQRVEQKEDTKAAVDAAFSAAKEAVREQTTASDRAIAKSEAAMTEQLKQLSTTFTTAIGGVTNTQDDLKERVSRIESVKQGGKETIDASTKIIAAVIGTVVFLLTVYAAFRTGANPS